jgi:hypothetical protein
MITRVAGYGANLKGHEGSKSSDHVTPNYVSKVIELVPLFADDHALPSVAPGDQNRSHGCTRGEFDRNLIAQSGGGAPVSG